MITVMVYNPELTVFDDLTVGLDLSYPFQAISGESYERRIGDLAATSSAYTSFRLKTYEDVPEGEYPLRVYHCSGECAAKNYKDIYLQFSGTSDLRLVNYSFSTQTIIPEEDFTITLSIKNFGTGKLRDLSVQINNSLQGLIPFLFKDKANNYYLGDLNPDSTMSIAFKVAVNDELEPGVYSIPVIVNTPTQSLHVGHLVFKLSAKADLTIPLVETEPVIPTLGKPVTIMATLENVGPGDAKSVVAVLEKGSKIVGANYIGKVESADDDVALFEIVQDAEKDYVVRVTYTDDLGEHEITKNFTSNYEVVTDFSWIQNLLVLSGLVVIAFVVYKKKLKK